MSTSSFSADTAFNQAFDEELAEYPPDANWFCGGRPSKAHPHGEDAGWWRDNGPNLVKAWIDWRERTPWDVWVTPDGQPAIELGLELAIDGEPYKLFIDRVFATGPDNTRPVVFDLKSGGAPIYDWSQVGLYKVAIELTWPEVKIAGGTYWLARNGETVGVTPLDQYTPRYFGALARRERAIRRAGAFLPNVGSHCRGCEVGRFCAINGGAESHLDPDFQLMGE